MADEALRVCGVGAREDAGAVFLDGGRAPVMDVDGRVHADPGVAVLLGGRPSRSTDHDLLRWVPQSQLAAFQWCPADAVAVAFLGHGGEPNAGRSASSLP